MMRVYLPADDPFGGSPWGAVSPLLALAGERERANVTGGPMSAEVSVNGPVRALWECLRWLRRPVELSSPEGMPVWWGFVNEVRLQLAGLTIGVSLDPMANRIAIAYSDPAADGGAERGTTPWAEDAASVVRYGYKEALISGGEVSAVGALAERATELAKRSRPRGTPSFNGGSTGAPTATLLCAGWFETLAWRRFTRLEGRIEFAENGSASQTIGWGLTSNQIGFGLGAIHHIGAKLTALETGDRLIVTGSTANNGTWEVDGATSAEQEVYTATTISFAPSDDINDSANGLGFIEQDSFILVAGSAANSGYHLVDETGSNHVATTFTPAITTEAAGPAITITQGHKVTVTTSVVNEAPGANVTLRIQGTQIAQSFVATHAFAVGQVGIPVGRVGNPADNFVLELWSNSAGAPGTLLDSQSVAGSSLAQDSQPWRWLALSGSVTMTAATTYWLWAKRSGANDSDNYYALGMTETVNGSCLAWTGSGWVAHPRSLYLPYKIWGAEDNGAQMARIATDCGQFLAGVDIPSVGVATNQYRSGDKSGYDEFLALLKRGDSQGRRLLATVTRERVLRVYSEPTSHTTGDRLLDDGSLRPVAGGRRIMGLLPVGEWLTVDSVPPTINSELEISPLFVDEAGWPGRTIESYEIVPKAADID